MQFKIENQKGKFDYQGCSSSEKRRRQRFRSRADDDLLIHELEPLKPHPKPDTAGLLRHFQDVGTCGCAVVRTVIRLVCDSGGV